jgi:spore germination protein YaaH
MMAAKIGGINNGWRKAASMKMKKAKKPIGESGENQSVAEAKAASRKSGAWRSRRRAAWRKRRQRKRQAAAIRQAEIMAWRSTWHRIISGSMK